MMPRPEPRLERVVVAVDLSEASLGALAWTARHVARGAELVLAHVIERPPPPGFLRKRHPSDEQIVDKARAAAESRLRGLLPSTDGPLVVEVRAGKPDEEIVRVAAECEADLIVLGRDTLHPDGWGRVGTTAQRVLRRAHVPVLVVGATPDHGRSGPPSHVVVAVDDSAMTTSILHWGEFLGQRFSAETTAVHILSTPLYPGSVAIAGWLGPPDSTLRANEQTPDDEAVAEARRWLNERVRAATHAGHVSPVIVASAARPAQAIVEEARRREDALIVIGSRGAGSADRLLFGTVAEAVVRDAPSAVLVVVPRSR
jgi:universal stress protein E